MRSFRLFAFRTLKQCANFRSDRSSKTTNFSAYLAKNLLINKTWHSKITKMNNIGLLHGTASNNIREIRIFCYRWKLLWSKFQRRKCVSSTTIPVGLKSPLCSINYRILIVNKLSKTQFYHKIEQELDIRDSGGCFRNTLSFVRKNMQTYLVSHSLHWRPLSPTESFFFLSYSFWKAWSNSLSLK